MSAPPRAWRPALLSALAVLWGACANPVPPTGGPVDATPPRLTASTPAADAVNVREGTVRLTFSEAVDPETVARALSVTPEPDRAPDIEVDGRNVTVRLGPLRPDATYLLTLDATLRDRRGVALTAPIVLAFATGARIDRGTLEGLVADAATGAPRPGVDVLAYADVDTSAAALPDRPAYRTQTGADGRFRLGYLAPGPLFVVAVTDRNRNRRVDAGEAFAAPPRAFLLPRAAADTTAEGGVAAGGAPADSTSGANDGTWLLALPDTAAPRAERVRSYSATRHAVRYTEPVRPSSLDAGAWALVDTAGGRVPVLTVYASAREPRQVFFVTGPLAPRAHRLTPGPAADSAGNEARAATLRFTPSPSRDTLRARFVGFEPDDGLLVGDERPALQFTAPPADSAAIIAADTSGVRRLFRLTTDDGTRYRVETALPVVVTVSPPLADSARAQRFRRLDARELGGLAGTALGGRVVVEARGETGRLARAVTDAAGRFALTGLPAGPYRLVAFLDRDGDGRWTPGRLAPYRAPEPLLRLDAPQNVRARWDAELADTLRLR